MKWRYAAAVMINPGGTGKPALVISPKLAPLPPTVATSSLSTSLNHTTNFFAMISVWGILTPCASGNVVTIHRLSVQSQFVSFPRKRESIFLRLDPRLRGGDGGKR